MKKNQEDLRNFKNEQLGQPKNLGQEMSRDDAQKVFGGRLGGPDPWNAGTSIHTLRLTADLLPITLAGKCINGDGNLKDVKVDSDLGRTNRYGFRNTTREGDENRVFGVPTIRSDIRKSNMKSIADPTVRRQPLSFPSDLAV